MGMFFDSPQKLSDMTSLWLVEACSLQSRVPKVLYVHHRMLVLTQGGQKTSV